MFVNIHTHTTPNTKYPAIRNLDFAEAEVFFSSNEKAWVSVGIHPWDVVFFKEELLTFIEKWSADERLVAIGECGLDKNGDATIEKQLDVLSKQIDISELVRKPLIIHCVGCFNELLELKKTIKPKQLWIIHGFRGKPQLAEQVLKTGCALSFGKYFNPDSVRVTPLEKIFVETDESQQQIEEIYRQIAVAKNCNPTDINAGWIFFQQIQSTK
ncbi:MAG: TatD family hydrolase [Paludibacter sp.]